MAIGTLAAAAADLRAIRRDMGVISAGRDAICSDRRAAADPPVGPRGGRLGGCGVRLLPRDAGEMPD